MEVNYNIENSVLEKSITFNNPIQQALHQVVMSKKEQIFDLLHLVRKLQAISIAETKEKVLCHGDIWGGNLIRHQNELYFIDWESVILAPPEYNFVSYIGEEFDVFFSAYEKNLGKTISLNPDLLRFYSYRNHLRNLTNWLMNILHRNTEEVQSEKDLDKILYHCMNRWDSIEANVIAVDALLKKRL